MPPHGTKISRRHSSGSDGCRYARGHGAHLDLRRKEPRRRLEGAARELVPLFEPRGNPYRGTPRRVGPGKLPQAPRGFGSARGPRLERQRRARRERRPCDREDPRVALLENRARRFDHRPFACTAEEGAGVSGGALPRRSGRAARQRREALRDGRHRELRPPQRRLRRLEPLGQRAGLAVGQPPAAPEQAVEERRERDRGGWRRSSSPEAPWRAGKPEARRAGLSVPARASKILLVQAEAVRLEEGHGGSRLQKQVRHQVPRHAALANRAAGRSLPGDDEPVSVAPAGDGKGKGLVGEREEVGPAVRPRGEREALDGGRRGGGRHDDGVQT